MLENLEKIKIETPVDKIIKQIRSLITSGRVKPGDKLPPERKLAEQLGVGRKYVRDAINKLEFYGILKTMPQSGTIVAGLGIAALEGMVSDVLDLDQSDFSSLVETRVFIEREAARLAAMRRTDKDIQSIESAMLKYQEDAKDGLSSMEVDLMFHLKIVEATHNSVMRSLMLIISPDVLKSFTSLDVCNKEKIKRSIDEHIMIFNAIKSKDPEAAVKAMDIHLNDVLEYSETIKNQKSKENGINFFNT